MAVYVDPLFDTSWADKSVWPYDQASHMMADNDDELHAMAAKLKLRREWHQECPPHSVSHYDLTKGKRWQAIRHGAVEVDRGFVPERHRRTRNVFLGSSAVGDIGDNSDVNVAGGEQISSGVDAQSVQPDPLVQPDVSSTHLGTAPPEPLADSDLLSKPPEVDH